MLDQSRVLAESELVGNFYNGKSVLITGGTGSLGKILLEKLLRSCWGLENVYLLVRPKQGQMPERRLTEMLSVPLYDRLKEASPEIIKKIVIIEGDLIQPNLDLSDSSKKTLIDRVSVVFHCAATVRFDEPLEKTLAVNFTGTRELVQLCKKMPKMKAFLHVSTLFSNYPESSFEERIYPLRSGLDGTIDYNKLSAEEIAKKIPEEWLKLWPNTYTISKAIVENYLNQEKENLPISIVRPSIILSTVSEPFPGWIDNFYGPTVIVGNTAKGLLRTMLCDVEKTAHIVPSDLVANMIICVATKKKPPLSHDIEVYNCCSSSSNRLTWERFGSISSRYIKLHPLNDVIWYPDMRHYSCYMIYRFFYILQNYLPAYVLDLFSKMSGRKVRMVRICNSIHKIIMMLRPFTSREWSVCEDNSRRLIGEMKDKDRETFPFDFKQIEWDRYCEDYVKGIKVHLLKESLDGIDVARARVRKFFWIEKALQCFTFGLMMYFIYYLF